MLTTKFRSIIVLLVQDSRRLGNRLSETQLAYLGILGLTPEVFIDPKARLSHAVVSWP